MKRFLGLMLGLVFGFSNAIAMAQGVLIITNHPVPLPRPWLHNIE